MPCQPLMRIFSTTRSPCCGSSPSAGAAPQVPRTSAFVSLTPLKSGALSCEARARPARRCTRRGSPARPSPGRPRPARPRSRRRSAPSRAAGEPDSANAPPSMITSFCRSWIISAQRFGSSFSSSFIGLLSPSACTARGAGRPSCGSSRATRSPGCRACASPSPPQVRLPTFSGTSIVPRCSPLGADHPDALRAGDPDVAALVALHPVGDALLDHAGADALEEHAPVRERAVRVHVPDLDVRPRRVVDVEQRLVRREAEPVRHVELVSVDDRARGRPGRRRAGSGRRPASRAPGSRSMPEAGEAPVPRIGEVDRAVRADADVVRAVELLALVVVGEQSRARRPAARAQRARDVLADEQVEVVRRRSSRCTCTTGRITSTTAPSDGVYLPPDVAGHVGEEQVVLRRVPDRPLGEGEARREALDLGALLDELVDRVRSRVDSRHSCPLS